MTAEAPHWTWAPPILGHHDRIPLVFLDPASVAQAPSGTTMSSDSRGLTLDLGTARGQQQHCGGGLPGKAGARPKASSRWRRAAWGREDRGSGGKGVAELGLWGGGEPVGDGGVSGQEAALGRIKLRD